MERLSQDPDMRFTELRFTPAYQRPESKLNDSKGSFCIDALLSKRESPNSPENSRSDTPSSTRSRSPPISPGREEEIPQNPFVPRPGLLNHISNQLTPFSGPLYGYQGSAQTSAFHHAVPMGPHNPAQLQQLQLEWLSRAGVIYPRFPDLTGRVIFYF